MLYHYLSPFLDYFKLAEFSNRSVQAMTSRIKEFQLYLKAQKIKSIKKVHHKNLVEFAGDFQTPSIHITKSRVWMLHHFYRYLNLHEHVKENIALQLSYPKIEKTIPDFLTSDELNRLIQYFAG
ncbi:MAG: integrase, partial [Desulfobacteraceae bacterium]|nr:integrase [Desulfobacteraceae bacterium]